MVRRIVPVAFVAMKLPGPERYAPVPASAIACRSDDATGLPSPASSTKLGAKGRVEIVREALGHSVSPCQRRINRRRCGKSVVT